MLTWTMVIGFTLLGLAVYIYALLHNNVEDQEALLERLEQSYQQNEEMENNVTSLKEEVTNKKEFLRFLVQEAKNFREESRRIATRLPELEAEAVKWEEYELTEKQALAQYKKWKKERMQHG